MPSETPDQHVHQPSLSRVVLVILKVKWDINFSLSANSRHWSNFVDAHADLNLRLAHM